MFLHLDHVSLRRIVSPRTKAASAFDAQFFTRTTADTGTLVMSSNGILFHSYSSKPVPLAVGSLQRELRSLHAFLSVPRMICVGSTRTTGSQSLIT
jgi:hypothetical protein